MSSIPPAGPNPGPHIVVVGNHKGGSGKSTLAMHIIVALLKERRRVASFDVDLKQQTLTRYLENRREWAIRQGMPLELPTHCPVGRGNGTDPDLEAEVAAFISSLGALHDHDFIVIDTPSGESRLSLLAHGMADTLISPINDSFIDLDVIMTVGPSHEFEPSCYAATVSAASRARQSVSRRPTDWIVVRNRLSPQPSNNQRQVADVLAREAPKIGFRSAPGLSERVVFREFFPVGLTAFDAIDKKHLGTRPSMAHLLARIEVRELIEAIGLVPWTLSSGLSPADDKNLRLPSVALLEPAPPPQPHEIAEATAI